MKSHGGLTEKLAQYGIERGGRLEVAEMPRARENFQPASQHGGVHRSPQSSFCCSVGVLTWTEHPSAVGGLPAVRGRVEAPDTEGLRAAVGYGVPARGREI